MTRFSVQGAVQSPTLARIPGLVHGFFGKTAPDGSHLNVSARLAASPAAAHAARDRAVALLATPGLQLCSLSQIHSNTVLTLEAPLTGAPEADAMVTDMPGLALGIVTADCAPLLFADPVAGVIGAAHAGWRGAVDGIAQKTVAAMIAKGARAENIVAAIGPAISLENYEVGTDRAAEIATHNPAAKSRISIPKGGQKPHFDVPGFLADDLARAGIKTLEQVGGCTYAQPQTYYSHRYATHHGGPEGRQISLIALVSKM